MSKLITVYDDNDPLNNVLSALTLDVDEVFYVYHHEVSKISFINIEKVINKHKNIKTNFKKLIYDTEEIQELLDTYPDIIVDVGGAKYLSLLLFELSINSDHKIIYYDDEENIIKNYRSHVVEADHIFCLSIEDVLTLKGGNAVENLHPAATDKQSIDAIYELVDTNIENYSAFVKYITKLNNIIVANKQNKISETSYRLSDKYIEDIKKDSCYKRTQALFSIHDDDLTFKTAKLKELISVSGAFLENYIYHKLVESQLFDDVKMSEVIDFSNGKSNYPVRCEVDLLVLKNNKLLFVSCKSNKIDQTDIHEIYVHDKMFGNCLSKAVVCLCEEANTKYPSMYLKAYESGVFVIDKSNILEEDFPEVFNRIFNDTYVYDSLPI